MREKGRAENKKKNCSLCFDSERAHTRSWAREAVIRFGYRYFFSVILYNEGKHNTIFISKNIQKKEIKDILTRMRLVHGNEDITQ